MSLLQAGHRWARWGLRRVGVRLWPLIYFETGLKDPPPEVIPGVDVSIRRVPSDEALERIGEFEREAQPFLARDIEAGCRCYFAEHEGRLAAYSWVSPQAIRWGSHRLAPLADQGVYSYTSFVYPQFRGNKLFQYLLAHIYRELRDEGYEFLCNIVARNNATSIRVREKLGAVGKPLCLVYVLRQAPRVWGGPIGKGDARTRRSEPTCQAGLRDRPAQKIGNSATSRVRRLQRAT